MRERTDAVTLSDEATIIYTSGTTGIPKGVVLTHGNFISPMLQAYDFLPVLINDPKSRSLLFLPVAHVLARFVMYCLLAGQGITAFSPDTRNLVDDIATFKPTMLLVVPRVMEKVYNAAAAKAGGGMKGRMFAWAAKQARACPRPPPTWILLCPSRRSPDPVRTRRPSRMPQRCPPPVLLLLSSCAAASPMHSFCRGSGDPRPEPAHDHLGRRSSGSRPGELLSRPGHHPPAGLRPVRDDRSDFRGDSAGLPPGLCGLPVARQPHEDRCRRRAARARYLRVEGLPQPARGTAEAYVDGWFKTGDLASIDDRGHLRITGRKKELIVTAGGKNVSPEILEESLSTHPLIANIIVVGDNRPYIGALIALDTEMLPEWLSTHGLPVVDAAQAATLPRYANPSEKAIARANKAVSRAESIRRYRIVNAAFTVENGYMTPSLKLKRRRVLADYADEVDALYASGEAAKTQKNQE